jgi:hypothetical protein
MATYVRILIPRKQVETIQTTQYIVPTGSQVVIDKFTATNTSVSNATLTVSLPAKSEVAGADNAVTYVRSIAPNETYTFPELIGQVINSEGFISTVKGLSGVLTITASGREIVQ